MWTGRTSTPASTSVPTRRAAEPSPGLKRAGPGSNAAGPAEARAGHEPLRQTPPARLRTPRPAGRAGPAGLLRRAEARRTAMLHEADAALGVLPGPGEALHALITG